MKKLTTQQWVLMAIVLAMLLILSMIPGFNYGNFVQIGVGFLGSAFAGALFGPVYAPLINVFKDILGYFLYNTGAFFPGFTLSAALGGFFYAKMLWRKEKSWKNVITAVLLNTVIVNLFLNTLWVVIMYDKAWMAIFPMRLAKNAVSMVFNSVALYYFFNLDVIKRLIKEFQF